jgi:putative addiction module component (TIGR02574 family)
MNTDSKKIMEEALKLSPMDRADLIEKLLSSFELSDRDEIDKLWAEEAESRINAYERGEIKSQPASKVFDEINKRYKRINLN